MHSFPVRRDQPGAIARAVLATMYGRYHHPDTFHLPLTARAIAGWTKDGLEHLDHVEFALAELRDRGWVSARPAEHIGQVWTFTARGLIESVRRNSSVKAKANQKEKAACSHS